jgi:CRP-like cAMP-binding protein
MDSQNNCIDILVKNNPVFASLNKSEIELITQNHTCSAFNKNEIIYKESERPNGLLCLQSGKVKIFKEGVGGREQIVRMAKPVSFIGYRALFADENYIASAQAIENSVICTIGRTALEEILRSNSDFSMRIIKALANELGFANKRTVTLTQKHIRGRLAESLLFLKDTYGLEEDGRTIGIYLSREDIAHLSNMTTSNAIRTLSAFAKEGVIDVNGRQISVKDLKQLEKISDLG